MHPGLQSVVKVNEEYPTKSKIFDSVWLMRVTKKISAGLYDKLNKPASLYHAIQGFMNMIQGETEPINTFKLNFDNIYEIMDLSDGHNTLCIKQLTKNGSQESTKEKQSQMDQIKAMCFLLSAYQKIYSFL